MTVIMSDKFDNPNFAISQENLELVNRKERESKSIGGMTSSWTAPPDPALVPPERMKMILESQAKRKREEEQGIASHPVVPYPVIPKSRLVTIPPQAMKAFKSMLNLFEAIQVNLTSEQSKLLLQSLEKQPTPKNMMDAKAIFNLMEMLQ